MRKDFGKQPLLFPMPVLIIGTYDESGEPNAMNAPWGSIYDMSQVTVSLADHVSTRNIRRNKAFTISLGHRMGILGCSTAEMKMSLSC